MKPAATIAHEKATRRIAHDFAERRNAILQMHVAGNSVAASGNGRHQAGANQKDCARACRSSENRWDDG